MLHCKEQEEQNKSYKPQDLLQQHSQPSQKAELYKGILTDAAKTCGIFSFVFNK